MAKALFDLPAREAFEIGAAKAWGGALVGTAAVYALSDLPMVPALPAMLAAGVMMVGRTWQGQQQVERRRRLDTRPAWISTYVDMIPTFEAANDDDAFYFGEGWEWDLRHTQLAYEMSKLDKTLLGLSRDPNDLGEYWIHGLERRDHAITLPKKALGTHTFIVGTTGAGKTRAMEVLIHQAVRRGETVIILDPKGDYDLMQTAKRACEMAGKPEKFLFFHPSFPNESARINPLYHFDLPSSLATRIAVLIPSKSGDDPFKSFAQRAINNVVQGILLCKRRPTIMMIRSFLESGTEQLVLDATDAWFSEVMPAAWASRRAAALGRSQSIDARAKACTKLYHEIVAENPRVKNQDLEGLLNLNAHNKEHFGKMIAVVLPVFDMLTSGHIGPLLSPDDTDLEDTRLITDSSRILANNQVAYIGLNTLPNSMTGQAIGSIMLADFTAAAGAIYNEPGGNKPPVNFFADEAAEIINDQFIQLANKGRGAGFRLYVATQTFADFESKTGSKAAADMIRGNLNNLILLRSISWPTNEAIAKSMKQVSIATAQDSSSVSLDDSSVLEFSGGVSRRVSYQPSPLIQPDLYPLLPNGECIVMLAGGRTYKVRIPMIQEGERNVPPGQFIPTVVPPIPEERPYDWDPEWNIYLKDAA